jgi:hypothetical protein
MGMAAQWMAHAKVSNALMRLLRSIFLGACVCISIIPWGETPHGICNLVANVGILADFAMLLQKDFVFSRQTRH